MITSGGDIMGNSFHASIFLHFSIINMIHLIKKILLSNVKIIPSHLIISLPGIYPQFLLSEKIKKCRHCYIHKNYSLQIIYYNIKNYIMFSNQEVK